ncbi:toll/interleukin-1 receptor domain-containing protein [Microbacterium paludicola]|uniref:toll/interleukin-1 receptor domain-containing protein n=1 Tax=Microbacterium paludicola TaxID=300019 RepID=UPI0031DE0B1D
MKPGERIPLIKASIDALLPRMDDDATLVLNQFGAQLDGSYGRDTDSRRSFLTWAVQELSDETLLGLHDYLVGDEQAPVSVSADDDPWTDLPIRVFLSHKWEDAEWVSSLRSVLAKYGITAFVAHKDITPSKQWREVIKAGLRSCHMMVAVLHDDFHKSQWCDQEVGWALGRGIPIATLRRSLEFERGTDGFLEEVQDIQLDPSRGTGEWRAAQEIFRAAIRSVKPPELVRRALAEALVASPSWENTRNLWSAIARQDQWEQASLDRIKFAVQTNRQVYDAMVGERQLTALVDELVQQYEPKPIDWSTGDETPF